MLFHIIRQTCSLIRTCALIEIFYSIKCLCLRTVEALIRLRGCTGWSGPSPSVYGRRHIFAWCEPVMKSLLIVGTDPRSASVISQKIYPCVFSFPCLCKHRFVQAKVLPILFSFKAKALWVKLSADDIFSLFFPENRI